MVMAEYIEREALIEKISEIKPSGAFTEALKELVLIIISEQPTADVQEVRHGKWLYEDSDIGWTDYKCSDCGNIISTVAQDEDLYSYCPNCGAKMDKE